MIIQFTAADIEIGTEDQQRYGSHSITTYAQSDAIL